MSPKRPRRKPAASPAHRLSSVLGLQRVALFRGLDAYDLREIAARCRWTRHERNQTVIRRDGKDRDVYFVISGMVRVVAVSGTGRRIVFRDLPPGEVFGEHSAIDGQARFADVVAASETLLAALSAEDFRAILNKYASVRERLLQRFSASVRELADRVLDLGAEPVPRRIGQELVRLARLAGVEDNMARISPAPTHRDLAGRVGTTREQATRALSRMARDGWLAREGRTLVLRDLAGFERLCGARLAPDPGERPTAMPMRERTVEPAARQWRAILMVGMCDAVAMMERDEARAVERYRTFLAYASAEAVPNHGGRSMSRLPTEGLIAEFPDGVQALRCAFALHRDLARLNPPSGLPPLRMRAGIHAAEVIVETFDVLGDGVNVAAGLAELANAGETVASAQLRDRIASGVDATVEDLGEQRLRNRAGAVRAFRLWPLSADAPPVAATRTHGRPSIAVLPFHLRSDDARFAAIGDGLADETIAALSGVADFFIISRLSTMAFRSAPIGALRIGEMLGAQYVLSGSVHSAYPRALLLAELADARNGGILWSERFEGDLADMFAMQGALARRVAASVAPLVRSLELRRARITSFEQLDAYGITLRGVEMMHHLSPEAFAQARMAFETAIERDPLAPAPHAWLAKWHVMRVGLGASGDPAADSAAAVASADRALACDAHDALALSVDALVSAWSRQDLDAAERRLALALSFNPNEPLAWLWSSTTHAWRGRGDEAVRCAERALALSPLDPMTYYFNSLASTACLVGERYGRAIELAERSLLENGLHTPSLRTLAVALVLSGRLSQAREVVRRLRALEPALTVAVFRARYPGRESPQAERFAAALLAAGLPA